ncbi:MAG: hypothetical protein RIQ81_2366 [Pseudomonadota bacterium]
MTYMKFIKTIKAPAWSATVLYLFSFYPALGAPKDCPVSHRMSLDMVLDDKDLLGSLNEESRAGLNQWAAGKIDRFAANCSGEAAMEHYGMDVRNGLRRLVWDLEAGQWHHTRWLRRHGVITTTQLSELFKISLSADANANARAALKILNP